MKRIAKNFAVILLCLVCLGCTSHSARLLIGSRHNPTNPDAVAVDEGMPIQPYEVIGKVHSHCRWNWFFSWAACGENTMMENLRQEAEDGSGTYVVTCEPYFEEGGGTPVN